MKIYKHIFVDYFDTLVHRTTSPKNVLNAWAHKMEEFSEYKISSKVFLDARIYVEKDISNIFWKNNGVASYEDYVSKIIEVISFNKKEILNFDKKNLIKNSLIFDEEIELNVQRLNLKVIQKILKDKSNGSKIFCVSDFYLPKSSYYKFFKKHGIENLFDEVYVSCEELKSKRTGTLYSYILRNQNLKPSDCLMIGDNNYSDYLKAKEHRINAILLKNKFKKHYLKYEENAKKERKKKLNKIFKQDYGFCLSNLSFSLFLFIEKLYIFLVENGINKIYFLSREGQFLQKLFDVFQSNKKDKISTQYLMASRHSTFLASLSELEKEKFDVFFRQYNKNSIGNFLKSLQFSDSEIKKIESSENLDFSQIIDSIEKSDEFLRLKQNDTFKLFYEQKRTAQKQEFLSYFNSINTADNNQIVLVDVGWKGSMQDNLYRIFNKNQNLLGCYLGLYTMGNMASNNFKKGFLFDAVQGGLNPNAKIFSMDSSIYEFILKADHGKVLSYKEGEIQFEKDRDVELYNQHMKSIQFGIEQQFKAIQKVFDNDFVFAKDVEDIFANFHLKMFLKLRLSDFKALKQAYLKHEESFGIFKNVVGYSFLSFLKKKVKMMLILLGLYEVK